MALAHPAFHTLRRCPCGAIPITSNGWRNHVDYHRRLEERWDYSLGGSHEIDLRSWSRVRRLVLIRDRFACRVCGTQGKKRWRSGRFDGAGVEVHHIIPIRDGGGKHPRNLITLCRGCHRATFRWGYGGVPEGRRHQRSLEAFASGIIDSQGQAGDPRRP